MKNHTTTYNHQKLKYYPQNDLKYIIKNTAGDP